jgi:hypothetical protein
MALSMSVKEKFDFRHELMILDFSISVQSESLGIGGCNNMGYTNFRQSIRSAFPMLVGITDA